MAESSTTTTDPAASPAIIVGIDLGALATKITLGAAHEHELVRNAHGGHTTPSALTFPLRSARLLGEDAADASRADGNTVGALERLLPGATAVASGLGDGGEDVLATFRRYDASSSEEPRVRVPNADADYSGTALVAMLLGNVRCNAAATVTRLAGAKDGGAVAPLHFVFAVPPGYPASARAALTDAAYAASVPRASVVDATRCMAAVYERKFGEAAEATDRAVLVVEVGHARSCVAVLKNTPVGEGTRNKVDDLAQKEGMEVVGAGVIDNEATRKSRVTVLSTVSSPTLGAVNIDVALYRHFLATDPSLSHHTLESLKTNSRQAQRLLEGCRKLKHLLSMLPKNTVTVESIGKNDTDVNLSCTRELLKQLCGESVVERLKGMIAAALESAGGSEALGGIEAVEITGGGTRIPFVQEAIREALGKEEGFSFSRSLDDTSLAFGASLVGVAPSSCSGGDEGAETMEAGRVARREELLKAETALTKCDVQLRRKDELRNQIEAHVLELRSARHSKHGALLPTSGAFAALLDGTDEWLFSEECDEMAPQQMEEKWNSIEAETNELCKEFFAAKRADAKQKDLEMERSAQKAAAEAAANGDDEEADHDTRRLPTKRRMDIVLKNKKEANELVADGNYKHAAARYAKAMTHCTKFFDLSPAEEEEVKAVKLSLHLNAALAYLKLEKLDHALRSCDDALALDGRSVKALYRRATVLYRKRKFDDATADLKEAERWAPEDRAVKKLRRLVDQQMEKQKKKEKAMAQKMFG